MDVAIVRGPYLNKSEIQSFEPLANFYNIIVYYSKCHYHDVNIINLQKRELRRIEDILGCKTNSIFVPLFHIMGFKNYMICLENELRKFDVAHTLETFLAFSYQTVRAKLKYGTKIIVTQFENIPHNYEQLLLCKYIKSIVLKKADLFIAITNSARRALIHEGVSPRKICVIPSGIDLNRFRPSEKDKDLMKKFQLNENDLVILFVGQLIRQKGIYDLVFAFKRLLQDEALKYRNIKLVICGKGPEEKGLLTLIRGLHISEATRFVGEREYQRIEEVHNLADIFVLPSIPTHQWQEQFGMVLVEAMACGKPVVSTFTGAIPEVVASTETLVPPNNPLALYEKLKILCLDDEKRGSLGNLGRKIAEERYDHKLVATKLKTVYETLA